jgi:hypothetical protein
MFPPDSFCNFGCEPSLVERGNVNQRLWNVIELAPNFQCRGFINPSGGPVMSKSIIVKNSLRTGVLLVALGLAGTAAYAAVSPFRVMAGSWSGGGTISMSDGQQEPLRCRASYDVDESGSQLHLNLRCASASYNFDLASDVEYRGGAVSGQWSEASRNVSGTLQGRAAGDRIEVAANSQSFTANLSLTTHGNRQTVSIRPEGGSDIRDVSLALARR